MLGGFQPEKDNLSLIEYRTAVIVQIFKRLFQGHAVILHYRHWSQSLEHVACLQQ